MKGIALFYNIFISIYLKLPVFCFIIKSIFYVLSLFIVQESPDSQVR